jgi:hypothetical protein
MHAKFTINGMTSARKPACRKHTCPHSIRVFRTAAGSHPTCCSSISLHGCPQHGTASSKSHQHIYLLDVGCLITLAANARQISSVHMHDVIAKLMAAVFDLPCPAGRSCSRACSSSGSEQQHTAAHRCQQHCAGKAAVLICAALSKCM